MDSKNLIEKIAHYFYRRRWVISFRFRSSCGIGFVANLKGVKKHSIIKDALGMLGCMEHRGGTGFDIKSGDGAGILLQIPHKSYCFGVL